MCLKINYIQLSLFSLFLPDYYYEMSKTGEFARIEF